MTEPALTLIAESSWTSPWVFHAMVALEEKALPYRLDVTPWPLQPARKRELEALSIIGKVPVLVHGDVAITESLAISEYLAETFAFPAHPRIFPAALPDRARARQVMGYLRTDTFALREDRPTTSVLGAPVTTPLSDKGRAAAAELVRCAERWVTADYMFADFNIADADLALALMRLVANGDDVPPRLADYARRVWARPSVQRFLGHVSARTT
jgi:glutathione S-transferase